MSIALEFLGKIILQLIICIVLLPIMLILANPVIFILSAFSCDSYTANVKAGYDVPPSASGRASQS